MIINKVGTFTREQLTIINAVSLKAGGPKFTIVNGELIPDNHSKLTNDILNAQLLDYFSGNLSTNEQFRSTRESCKGEHGELLVRSLLAKKAFVVEVPFPGSGAHINDGSLMFPPNYTSGSAKRLKCLLEIKSKAPMAMFPDTGFDFRNLKAYIKKCQAECIDCFVAFVDEQLGLIYGNWLSFLLLKTHRYFVAFDSDFRCEVTVKREYPNHQKGNEDLILFPLDKMIPIGRLAKEDVTKLKGMSNRKSNPNWIPYLPEDAVFLLQPEDAPRYYDMPIPLCNIPNNSNPQFFLNYQQTDDLSKVSEVIISAQTDELLMRTRMGMLNLAKSNKLITQTMINR